MVLVCMGPPLFPDTNTVNRSFRVSKLSKSVQWVCVKTKGHLKRLVFLLHWFAVTAELARESWLPAIYHGFAGWISDWCTLGAQDLIMNKVWGERRVTCSFCASAAASMLQREEKPTIFSRKLMVALVGLPGTQALRFSCRC